VSPLRGPRRPRQRAPAPSLSCGDGLLPAFGRSRSGHRHQERRLETRRRLSDRAHGAGPNHRRAAAEGEAAAASADRRRAAGGGRRLDAHSTGSRPPLRTPAFRAGTGPGCERSTLAAVQAASDRRCQLTWPDAGLRLTLVGRRACAEGTLFGVAMWRRGWKTHKDLGIGDGVPRLRRLYPRAIRRQNGRWRLYKGGSRVRVGGLFAHIKQNRVDEFWVA
jgi:hypothetical protein